MNYIRFGIAPTYKCNMSCKWCNRFLDEVCWADSDLTTDDLKIAGKEVHRRGLQPGRIRLTGGEPLCHPEFHEVVKAVRKFWNPVRCIVSFTNGLIRPPAKGELPVRFASPQPKQTYHEPWAISPADLGISPCMGADIMRPCSSQIGCGRLFDAFGFSFCVHAGALGRLLRIDPYSSSVSHKGMFDICKHCICSISRRRQKRLKNAVLSGDIEYPTKTYVEGIKQLKEQPFVYKRFQER